MLTDNLRNFSAPTIDMVTASPGSVDVSKISNSALDKDNLWMNPSSEISPITGADTTQPEWADRVNAGAGAYSGSWVRQTATVPDGFWLPCSPGAQFYAEAQAKRTAGAGAGGQLLINFYDAMHGTLLAAVTSPTVTAATWTKTAVTSAAAPAGTNAVRIAYYSNGGDTMQFDSLLARRVMQSETIASEVVTLTDATGWTNSLSIARKIGALISGTVFYTAGATAAWATVFTLAVGARPLGTVEFAGRVYDSSASTWYTAVLVIGTNGVVQVAMYDNGTALVLPFAIGVGDQVVGSFSFAAW